MANTPFLNVRYCIMIGSDETCSLIVKPVIALNLLSISIMTPSAPIILNEHRDLDMSFLRKFQLFCQQLILNSRQASHRSTFRTQLQTDQYPVLSTKTKIEHKEEKSLTVRTSQRKRAIAFQCLLLLLLSSFFFSQGIASAIKGSLKNKHENISSIRPPQMAALLETSACVGSQVSDACTVQLL